MTDQIYKQLCNNTPDLMWSVNKEYYITGANKAFMDDLKKLTGITLAPGDHLLIEKAFSREVLDWWKTSYKRALLGEIFTEEIYTAPTFQDAEGRWMAISFYPLYQDNQINAVTCYARNTTECKKKEQMLCRINMEQEQKAKKLAASNSELEHFAYVASHDLQEPLRMVSQFLQLLQKKYADKINEEASTYIKHALDGANRMRRLISDLLEYSKAGSYTMETGATDMNEVAGEILNILQYHIQELRAEVKIMLLPILYNTSKSQMLHLLLNLLDNALKYHGDNIPQIQISAAKEDGYWIFSVKDNGIGIEPGFEDKIFEVFKRLHTENEYAGTGIGLAISKKIVEKHGGIIWVASEPGQGSTFYFTIAQQEHG